MGKDSVYARPDRQTVYLKNVLHDPALSAGDWTMYNDFEADPALFEKNNVLYHYACNRERLVIGKYCSIACGAKFIFTSANHTRSSLSTYPFGIFFGDWDLPVSEITSCWDNKGDIVIGSDVWIGYHATILQGVTIGDGAIIGAHAVVSRDVPPYTVVGGIPARPIRRRFDEETVARLLRLRWWDWPDEKVKAKLPALRAGDLDALER